MINQVFKIKARHLASTSSNIKASTVLFRKAQVLRSLSDFEKAYYAYREWVARDESRPFPMEFYFKKGTPGEARWIDYQNAMDKHRGGIFGGKEPVIEPVTHYRSRDLADIEFSSEQTADDESGNIQSLNRKLKNTLYLVAESASLPNTWTFPSAIVPTNSDGKKTALHEAAKAHLLEQFGHEIDTWYVGKTPIGHLTAENEHTFFVKAYILAGKAQLAGNNTYRNFAWLSKDELSRYFAPEYFNSTKDLLLE